MSLSRVATSSPRQPPVVPDYELLRCIGRGSYGDVWLARNVLGDYRAVKFIYRERFADPRPFEREFEGIQRFEPISRSHPSQLHILHVGKNDAEGCFYYVMELADCAQVGAVSSSAFQVTSLERSEAAATRNAEPETRNSYAPHTLRHDIEQHRRLPIPDCVQIGLSLATALQHLHVQGLVHRDIKPSNVVFVNGVAKLGDIGLVTDVGDTQSIVGTEGYLSPEGPGTPQADLYSLGKVLYEISTGMDRRRFAELPEGLRTWPDAAGVVEFNEIVLKACAKDPARRYASAAALRADLELLRHGKSVKQRRHSQAQLRLAYRLGAPIAAVLLAAAALVALLRHFDWLGGPPVTLTNDDGTTGTQNAKAAAAYQLGLPALRRGTTEGLRQAVQQFTAAAEADPNFVAAQARLFESYLMGEDHGLEYIDGKAAALNALAAKLTKLAPTNAETHAALAIVRFVNEWKWTEADREFRKALQVDPRNRMALAYYGYFLTRLGRVNEAREVLNRAQQLNPESPLIMKFLGHCDFFARDYEKALQFYLKASEIAPTYANAHYWAGRAYLGMTNYLQALEEFTEFEKKHGYQWPVVIWQEKGVREALEKEGSRGLWTKLVQMEHAEVGDKEARQLYFYAECHARLGDTKRALEQLEQAYERHQGGENLLFDEFWDPLRREPKFKAILSNVGLEPWAR